MSSPCYGRLVSPENADDLKRAVNLPTWAPATKGRGLLSLQAPCPLSVSPPVQQDGTAPSTASSLLSQL